MRSTTPADLRGHCKRCFLRQSFCLCAQIPIVRTRTRFVILRHIKETWKTTNTGRLAALALPNSELVAYGTPGAAFDAGQLELPGTWVLFPEAPVAEAPGPAGPTRLIVLDGSWPQARRMMQRLPGLRRLPRLSLKPLGASRRLRRPLIANGMSTLEAIARAVAELEGEDRAAPLDHLHHLMVDRFLLLRGTPGRVT